MTTANISSSMPHDAVMAQMFCEDPDFARACLDVVMEEGSPADLCILMRQLALAHDTPQSMRLEASYENACPQKRTPPMARIARVGAVPA